MKRSEMVERLKYFFVSEDWCNEADDDFATEIIDFLVSQGMQPPPVLYEGKFGPIFYNDWEGEE
jgi:hypothetical protein